MPGAIQIAVVDDNSLIRGTVAVILESAGFTVYRYSCPTELIQSEHLSAIDCILTDLEMPRMNGCELQMHVSCTHPKLPVVFMTGSSDDGFRTLALKRGAFAYLSKPMRIQQMISIVEDAAAGYRMQRGMFPYGLAVAA